MLAQRSDPPRVYRGNRTVSFCVLILAYKPDAKLPELVAEIARTAEEIIVVNDGSADYTTAMLDEMLAKYPQLLVITHEANRGYGGALKSGFSAASKEWVFYTDGDSQYNPLELTELTRKVHEGADLVNGYKLTRNDSIARVVIGRAYHYLVKFLFNIRIRDVDCDFRLIPRHVLQGIQQSAAAKHQARKSHCNRDKR